MSEKPVPAGKWKLRPYDHKCKTFVDPNPEVEDQIRCRVPLWTGDFGEVIPEVIAHGCRFDELPKLTVFVVGQFVIRAAQGGSLRYGSVGTAAHAAVTHPDVDSFRELETWADRNLDETHWLILAACKRQGFVDRATARPVDDIAAYVAGDGSRAARGEVGDMSRKFKLLRDRSLLCSKRGVGTWVSPDGLRLLQSREASRQARLSVAQ
ncbi:MAG: hypothetical protein HQ464_08855 [Planctomycetes bacterium]|nr:hypothetical protein [Planctomycetota bacterium]